MLSNIEPMFASTDSLQTMNIPGNILNMSRQLDVRCLATPLPKSAGSDRGLCRAKDRMSYTHVCLWKLLICEWQRYFCSLALGLLSVKHTGEQVSCLVSPNYKLLSLTTRSWYMGSQNTLIHKVAFLLTRKGFFLFILYHALEDWNQMTSQR